MTEDGPTRSSTRPTPEVLAAVILAACDADRDAAVHLLRDTTQLLLEG